MKRSLTLILLLVANLAFGQSKEMYKKIADSLLAKGNSDELIKYFDKELKKYPRNEEVLRWLGYIHIAKNNLDLGEKYYSEALQVNPKCARCYLNIGNVYSLRGDNTKAFEYYDKAIKMDPDDALAYSTRARLKESVGDKIGALQDHDMSIEKDPNNFEYYVQRGLFNNNSGYQSLAISDLTKAIEVAPGNYIPYYQRASFYFDQKKLKEALIDINKAIELDSNQFSLYTGRGAIYDMQKEYRKAVNDYTRAISLNKNDFLPYLNRGLSYYKMEDLDASCSDYTFLKSMITKGEITDSVIISEVNWSLSDFCDTTRASYYYQRGIGFYNLKEYQKALDIYTTGLKKFPEHSMMLSFKGNAHLALNEYDKALVYYDESMKYKENILPEVKNSPKFMSSSAEDIENFYKGAIASTYFSMAECKINLSRFTEAMTDINKALELAPDLEQFNKEAYYNLRGHIYLAQGKYDLAINDFNKSIQLNKEFPLAYVNRAIARVSLAEKVKFSSFSLHNNVSNQPLSINWNSPSKSSLQKSESNFLSALADCNTAIQIDNKLGFAYYIRGQIKQMLNHSDYCTDLLTAKELGLTPEAELLKDCVK